MARALRVVLQPTPRLREGSDVAHPNVVNGFRVALLQLGPAPSLAKRTAESAAKLIFHVSMFKRIRGIASATPEKTLKVASLEGTVVFRGASRSPVFINGQDDDGLPSTLRYEDPELSDREEDALDSESAGTADSATPSTSAGGSASSLAESDGIQSARAQSPSPPRMLELEFDAGSFEGTTDPQGHNARLLLPSETNEFHFLEVDTELEIDGGKEQSLGLSDRLDVRMTPLAPPLAPAFVVRLFDEVGEPLDGVELSFKRGDKVTVKATDADGFARLVSPSDAPAEVTFVDPDGVRALLRERWNKVRGKPLVEVGPDVLNVEPRRLDDPLQVEADGNLFVCVRPRVILARLLSMFFDTNKSFLLPSIFPTIGELKKLFADNPSSDLLVVGHADTTAGAGVNDPLSLQRAEMVAAFLKDDVDTWLEQYDNSNKAQRWGSIEDSLMIQSLPDFNTKPIGEDEVRFFQRTRQLVVDGIAGKQTRTRLITEYMARDGAPSPPDIDFVTHGAGENFPLDSSGQDLDAAPPDDTSDPLDRRVELFFFEKEFGIQPPPPGKNSKKDSPEYPEWRLRASQVEEFDGTLPRLLRFRVLINGQVLASTPAQLFVDGVLSASQSTDANGFFESPIPGQTEKVVLQIPSRNLREQISVVVPDQFPSIDTLRGVQQRLGQLGFFTGKVDGRRGTETDQAVQNYKISKGLGPDSILDQATRAALKSDYGS